MLFNLGTIRKKLIATFTLLVCLTVGISLVAIILFGSTQEATNTIIMVNVPAVAKIHDLSVAAKGIAAAAPSLAASATEAELDSAYRTILSLLDQLNTLVTEFPKQQSEKANRQRLDIHSFVHEFAPVLKAIYTARRQIITLRKKVTDMLAESSSLSTALMADLEPIKVSSGFNLSLTLMELSNTDETEANFWRKQAFQTDLPNFQYSMELGHSIQHISSQLLQAADSDTTDDLKSHQAVFDIAIAELNQDLKKFGSKRIAQSLFDPIKAFTAMGQGEDSIFRLQMRQLATVAVIQDKIKQAHQIASDLTHTAQAFSGSIIDSARQTAERIHQSTLTGTFIAIGMALATILLAFVIGWRVVVRDIVRRISTLRLKMIDGHKGNLNLKINTRGSDEIADMSRAFAYFVSQMREDIATRRQNETRIHDAMQRAEAASEAKSNFLANMSHEIRTPMNGIIGYGTLLVDTVLDPQQQNYLAAINTSADHLLGVINDILDFSKIEAGHLELEDIYFNLRTNLKNAVNTMAVNAREKELRIVCQVADDVPVHVVGDPGRLRQIIVNLVNNAIKFTQVGEIRLNCDVENVSADVVRLHMSVTDTGVGIAVEKQGAIFDSFEQADTSTSREFGGTGLGLSISRQLVEMMGGRIWVESPGRLAVNEIDADRTGTSDTAASDLQGPGSTFHFTIQLRRDQARDHQVLKLASSELKDLRVLIVDSDVNCRRTVGTALDARQISHAAASTAQDALNKLLGAVKAQQPYDVVMTNGPMPEMDGFEMSRCIKTNPLLSNTMTLMLTSVGTRGDMARCKKNGVAGYLVKPVDPAELIELLEEALAHRANDNTSMEIPVVTRHMLQEASRHEKLKILLVEDNFINQKMAVKILESKGHDIMTADDGQQAIDRLKEDNFDIVLMDIQMPVMDGITATQVIRSSHDSYRDVPIVAMTAHAMKDDKIKCFEAGMDDYISKPFDPDQLFNILEKQRSLKKQSFDTPPG